MVSYRAFFVLLPLLGSSGCHLLDDSLERPRPTESKPASSVEGSASLWLSAPGVEDVPPGLDLEVRGKLAATRTDLKGPNGGYVYFQTGFSTRTLVIQTSSGRQWFVGYGVKAGPNPTGGPVPPDITPDLERYVGSDVHLLVRPSGGYHGNFGLVLTASNRVLLALERAVDMQALKAGDVPGLTIEAGAVVGERKEVCADYELAAIRFVADSPVESIPSVPATVAIGGSLYSGVALSSFRAIASRNCVDGANAGRSWALWLRE